MSYTTIALVRTATGFNDAALFSDAYIQSKIDGADGQIDSLIGDAYLLPLPSTPKMIASASLELTVAMLFIDQYGYEAKDGDKNWQKRWDLVLNEDPAKGPLGIAVRVQKGKAKLYSPTTGLELPRSSLFSVSSWPDDTTEGPQQSMTKLY